MKKKEKINKLMIRDTLKIFKFPTKTSPETLGKTGEFYQTFRKTNTNSSLFKKH
jgi:hypothetical protein